MSCQKKFKAALELLEKIILERDHLPNCPHYRGEDCICMDRRVYSKEKIFEEVCLFVTAHRKEKKK